VGLAQSLAADGASGTITVVAKDRGHQAWRDALVQALQDGTVLDLCPGEEIDVTQAASWPALRRLPGEALRRALLTPDAQPDPRGLTIRGAYITGPTDLAGLRLPHGLRFDSCAFEQRVDCSGLTIANLHFAHCTTPALIIAEAHIDGMVDLDGLAATVVAAQGAIIGGRCRSTPEPGPTWRWSSRRRPARSRAAASPRKCSSPQEEEEQVERERQDDQ